MRLHFERTHSGACFVLLILLFGAPAAGEPHGSADSSGIVEKWRGQLDEIEEMVRAEKWKAARGASAGLVEEMAALCAASAAGRTKLALVATYKAAAEAGVGRLDDALWSWQIAQNLDPELRQAPLSYLGAAGALFEQHRLRTAGTVPEHGAGDSWPPVPLEAALPDVPRTLRLLWDLDETDVEILIDKEGRVQAPVVLGGELPGKIYLSLEILRQWRFQPARAGGAPVPWLLRLRDLGKDSLPFKAARSERLRPIHELLAARLWQEAREASQSRIDKVLTATPGTPEAVSADRDLGEALVLRAVAEAGAGHGEEALRTWSASHSFSCPGSPSLCGRSNAGLEVYGVAGRLLVDHPPCLVAEQGCDALSLAAGPEMTPPRVVVAPAVRLPPILGPERLAAELLVDAQGRLSEARLIAGHSLVAGYLALEALREWRFEAARRGGEPVAVRFEMSIPLAPAAVPEEVDRLRGAMDRIADELVAGAHAEAAAELPGLLGELGDVVGAGGSDLLARALTELAVAEAGLGREEVAVWHWQMAQNLALEDRYLDLSAFGAAGDVLARNRLRYPGEGLAEGAWAGHQPCEPEQPPRPLAAPEPRYPLDAGDGAGDVAQIEILLDEAGRPFAPVVLGGRTPRLLVAALEALREWRFEPSAETEPLLHRVTIPLAPRRSLAALKLSPPVTELVTLAISRQSQGEEHLAGCLWQAAQSLDADLMAAELPPQAVGLDQILPTVDVWPYGDHRETDAGMHYVIDRVEPPVKVWTPQPNYTEMARRRRIQGAVILQGIIAKQGHVESVRVLQGVDPLLDVQAIKAVCRWRFQPARLDGEPVAVYYNLITTFRLGR